MGALVMLFSDCEKNDLGTCTVTCVCQGCTTTYTMPETMRKECKQGGDTLPSNGCCYSDCTYSFRED